MSMPARSLTSPRGFIVEYVDPALQIWSTNQGVTHLAVHALAQLDILAEVTFKYLVASGTASYTTSTLFRDDLGRRIPTLGLVRNAHDSHKHGGLTRATANNFRSGQRPENATKVGYFADISFADGPPTVYKEMIVELDDLTELSVGHLILAGRRLWDQELHRLQL